MLDWDEDMVKDEIDEIDKETEANMEKLPIVDPNKDPKDPNAPDKKPEDKKPLDPNNK